MSGARITLVDDDASFRRLLGALLEERGYRVTALPGEGDVPAQVTLSRPDAVLLDLNLPARDGLSVLRDLVSADPEVPVIMVTGTEDVATAVKAIRAGAFDYVTKPVKVDELVVSLERSLALERVARERDHYRALSDRRYAFVESRNPEMRQIYDLARRVARSETTTVLIQGESGTGKEHVAHLIHRLSARAEKPFLEINCASLPEPLLESELFGHEKGAFTDAFARKRGLLELADGGTLFLDEVGEMAPSIQVKLLRVLERTSFRRVGGTEDLHVSVRVLSATNRDLAKAVEAGRFREDLYFRLKVVPIDLPPLRDRPEDMPVLLEHFLQEFAATFAKRFVRVGESALEAATRYSWPGNIRELRNCMERAVLLHDGEVLEAAMLQIPGGPTAAAGVAELLTEVRRIEERGIPEAGIPFEELVASLERYLLRKASEKAGWNQSQAARYLQLNRDKLRTRMKNYDLGRPRD
ncbi:MAG: sigma-54 dependent transcriptional regulator [bacterium]